MLKDLLKRKSYVTFFPPKCCLLFLIILFIFGPSGSSLLCAFFSSCGRRGLLSSCRAQASRLQWLLLLQSASSGVHGLQ